MSMLQILRTVRLCIMRRLSMHSNPPPFCWQTARMSMRKGILTQRRWMRQLIETTPKCKTSSVNMAECATMNADGPSRPLSSFCRSQAPLGNASREAPLRIGLRFRFGVRSAGLDSPSGAWQDAFPSSAWERQCRGREFPNFPRLPPKKSPSKFRRFCIFRRFAIIRLRKRPTGRLPIFTRNPSHPPTPTQPHPHPHITPPERKKEKEKPHGRCHH